MRGIKKFIWFSRRWFQGNLVGIFILSQHILITQRTCYITQFFHCESNEKTCGKEFKNIIFYVFELMTASHTFWHGICIISVHCLLLDSFIDFLNVIILLFMSHTIQWKWMEKFMFDMVGRIMIFMCVLQLKLRNNIFLSISEKILLYWCFYRSKNIFFLGHRYTFF